MTDLAADGVPVTVSCRVLGPCRQQYYRWLAEPFTDAELNEAWLANAVFDAHRDDPEFGYRFLADEVRAAGHVEVGDRTVWRICAENGWWCSFGEPRRNRRAAAPATAAHDDLVRRQFNAQAPNQVWFADLTEHRTSEGKIYVCAIKDLFSNRIVGWAIDERMRARLVAALEMAAARRGDVAGCILHSDRGSQFRARKVHRALARHRMVGSMGNIGTAADNAVMESFFSLLQKNVLNTRRWDTRDQLRIAIVTWIERTYHRRRRQKSLGRLTPTEHES